MLTRYSEDQCDVRDVFGDLFARESTPERVRKAEAGNGFDPDLWDTLADTGVLGMALPEQFGGADASLTDLAVVVYEWGRHIAAVPLVEHAVATRVGAAAASLPGAACEDAAKFLEAAAGGQVLATLTLRPPDPDGTAHLVPAGAVAGAVYSLHNSQLRFKLGAPGLVARPNTAGLPLADRDLSGAMVIASGEAAQDCWERALAEWKALMAVAFAGMAQQALDIGVAYVKQRHQFGVPIGSFQAVQHGLAEAATRTEGARLLAFRSISALQARASNAAVLCGMALLFGAETARYTTDRALQYHGGYGYSNEYDIQLYYRRAAAWLLQLGEPTAEVSRLADVVLGPVRSSKGAV